MHASLRNPVLGLRTTYGEFTGSTSAVLISLVLLVCSLGVTLLFKEEQLHLLSGVINASGTVRKTIYGLNGGWSP